MSSPLPEDVRAALAAGKKIEAIRLLLQARRVSLKQAKAMIEEAGRAAAMKNGQSGEGGQSPQIMQSMHSGEGPSPGEVPRSKLSPGLVALVIVLVFAAWLLLGEA